VGRRTMKMFVDSTNTFVDSALRSSFSENAWRFEMRSDQEGSDGGEAKEPRGATAHRRGAGDPPRAVEPGTEHGARRAPGPELVAGERLHHRAQAAPDHDGEGHRPA